MNALYCLYIVFLLALGGAADGFSAVRKQISRAWTREHYSIDRIYRVGRRR